MIENLKKGDKLLLTISCSLAVLRQMSQKSGSILTFPEATYINQSI
jgi:hypothetical protein